MAQDNDNNTGSSPRDEDYGRKTEDAGGSTKHQKADTKASPDDEKRKMKQGKDGKEFVAHQDVNKPGHDEEDQFDIDSLSGKVNRAESGKKEDKG